MKQLADTRVGGNKVYRQRNVLFLLILVCLFYNVALVQSPDNEPYVLKYPYNFGGRFDIPADNPTTKQGVSLGRMLFYEKRLSAGNKRSCESCHQQKLAFTDGSAFSTGVDDQLTARSSMALVNLLWVRNFFWDGRASSLESQSIFPLTNIHEMGQPLDESAKKLSKTSLYPPLFQKAFGTQKISPELITKALAQFERTLISANSPYDKYLAGLYVPTTEEARGMRLFMDGPDPAKKIRGANCGHCHGGPKTFKELFFNNGLDTAFADRGREDFTHDPLDRGRFRVPTLRNIAITAPYMHDGRFKTLEEVLDHYNEHVRQSNTLSSFLQNVSNEQDGKTLRLKADEKKDIIAFLHMLTDSSFINNPDFANPHNTIQTP